MAPRDERITQGARTALGHYNQGRNPEHFTCPSCGLGFDTLDQQDAFAYNRHAEECELLMGDVADMEMRRQA